MLPWQVDRLEDVLLSSSAQPDSNTHTEPTIVSSEQPSSEVYIVCCIHLCDSQLCHTNVRTHTHTRTHTHAHAHTCMHARTHARTHACTHTHTHNRQCTFIHTMQLQQLGAYFVQFIRNMISSYLAGMQSVLCPHYIRQPQYYYIIVHW